MLIRCHSCQALFSLQDGVAAAGVGFKVECGRCLNVFEANGAARRLYERAGFTIDTIKYLKKIG